MFFCSATYKNNPSLHLDTPGIKVMRDGHHVARTSDFTIYSVEAEFIGDVVAQYGPCESLIEIMSLCSAGG